MQIIDKIKGLDQSLPEPKIENRGDLNPPTTLDLRQFQC
jgi:hypothetical protein